MSDRLKIVLVGGGSSAHVLAPLLSNAGHHVSVLTSRPHEWWKTLTVQFQNCEGKLLKEYSGTVDHVSDEPSKLVPEADVCLLCMPVHVYRSALHRIAPHLKDSADSYVGTVYGQAGFNWMMEEIKQQYNLREISYFAFGLLPWICRTIQYGHVGVTYGAKAKNVAAVFPAAKFGWLNENLFFDVCERWCESGALVQSASFLSLTLSVDNQIIHPDRCYGLFLSHGGHWQNAAEIPFFYRDFDEQSAEILRMLDDEYSIIRAYFRKVYPEQSWDYMLDYLALERFSYQSANTDIRESFVSSKTLSAIKPPVVFFELTTSNPFINAA